MSTCWTTRRWSRWWRRTTADSTLAQPAPRLGQFLGRKPLLLRLAQLRGLLVAALLGQRDQHERLDRVDLHALAARIHAREIDERVIAAGVGRLLIQPRSE